MRVLVRAYMVQNLGDDLFLDCLFTRYPNVQFEVEGRHSQYAQFFSQYANARCCEEIPFRDKLRRKMNPSSARYAMLKRYDAVIYVGGSIFMENENSTLLDTLLENEILFCARHNIPYYILSCSFGPYQSERYYQTKKKLFEVCTDVCFRDSVSYHLFRDVKTARMAPDMVFSNKIPCVDTVYRTIGVSAVDFWNRDGLKPYARDYTDFLISVCRKYIDRGYMIHFFDFCPAEGDGKMSTMLIDALGEGCDVIPYTGNLKEFTEQFLCMEKVICTRFHSIVLAMMAQKEMIPIIYHHKAMSLLRDCHWQDYAVTVHRMREIPVFSVLSAEQYLKDNKYKNVFAHTDKLFYGKK